MKFNWKRLSAQDVDKLIEKHSLNLTEREILKRLQKGKTQRFIADETTYSISHVEKTINRIYAKIKNDIT